MNMCYHLDSLTSLLMHSATASWRTAIASWSTLHEEEKHEPGVEFCLLIDCPLLSHLSMAEVCWSSKVAGPFVKHSDSANLLGKRVYRVNTGTVRVTPSATLTEERIF